MVKGVVFDLDDTLFYERDYVRSGFGAVAALTSPALAAELFKVMWDAFETGMRGTIFDHLLERYPELAEHFEIAELVSLYRNHTPEIDFLPEMRALLEELKERGVALAVISDGSHSSQAAKARALKLERYASPVILTDAWGRDFWKPHPKAFTKAAEALGLPPERLIYVADNPEKDFHAPGRLGWKSVRLRLPEQLRYDLSCDVAYSPSWEIRSVEALRHLLLTQLETP